MKSIWLKRTIYGALISLGIGIILMMVAALLIENGSQPDGKKWILIASGMFLNLFLAGSAFLWLHELWLRWKESVDTGSRVMAFVWLLITNIFGAYYFTIKRCGIPKGY